MLAIFKRKILDEMLRWKSSPVSEKKALVIKGLRRFGKTFTPDNMLNPSMRT